MSRAMVSFGTGPAAELLEIARPSFEVFAERHGYELEIFDYEDRGYWPAPWLKVFCLTEALERHDEVLWVDSDIVITDPSEDVPCREDAWQALAVHHTRDGEVPNTGVWLCRKRMHHYLIRLQEMREYRHHPWWEQGALMELLGYDAWVRPTVLRSTSALFHHTQFLSPDWNSHPWDEGERPRFRHATMHSDRAAVMREWAMLVHV